MSGAAFYGDGSNLSGITTSPITTYNTTGDNRVITSVDASTVQGEANLTFDGSKLASVGQISASLGVSGSSLETPLSLIAHVSSSLNISGAAFYGDGANITNLLAPAVATYNTSGDNRVITSVDSSTIAGEANLTFDGSKLSATGRYLPLLALPALLWKQQLQLSTAHISSSLNISGANFFGNGAQLTGMSPIVNYNTVGDNQC